MNYSTEKIFHFTCGKCELWWSIATEDMKMNSKSLSCPHCHYTHKPPHTDITHYGNLHPYWNKTND